jgi:hypothetical protein
MGVKVADIQSLPIYGLFLGEFFWDLVLFLET